MAAIMPSSSGVLEPLSLRRLRESISSLEEFDSRWHHPQQEAAFMEEPTALAKQALPEWRPQRAALPQTKSNLEPVASFPLAPTFATDSAAALERAERQLQASQREREEMQQQLQRQIESLQQERDDALRRNQDLLATLRDHGRLSDERIDTLTRERDTALRHCSEKEATVVRLQTALDSSTSKERQVREELTIRGTELQQLRAELGHHELKVQALERDQLHAEEREHCHERSLLEQKQRIFDLEAITDRATRDLSAREDMSSELAVLVFHGVCERAAVLRFLLDLLYSLRELCVASPSAAKSPRKSARKSRSPCRASSQSCLLTKGHKHKGCAACGAVSRSPTRGKSPSQRRSKQVDAGYIHATCQHIATLERDFSAATETLSDIIQRVQRECDSSALVVGRAPRIGSLDFVTDSSAHLVVDAWANDERRRLHCPILTFEDFVPRLDWYRESQLCHSARHAMEFSRSQLVQLRKQLRGAKVHGDLATGARE